MTRGEQSVGLMHRAEISLEEEVLAETLELFCAAGLAGDWGAWLPNIENY